MLPCNGNDIKHTNTETPPSDGKEKNNHTQAPPTYNHIQFMRKENERGRGEREEKKIYACRVATKPSYNECLHIPNSYLLCLDFHLSNFKRMAKKEEEKHGRRI